MFGLSGRLDFTVNLGEPLKETRLRNLLFTEDAESTEIHLVCMGIDGRPYDLTGSAAKLYVQRADGATVLINGTISGNDVHFTLPEAALIVQGGLKMAARIEQTTGAAPNQVQHRKVIWAGDAIVRLTSTDSIVDSSSIIPSLSELLAQIERMENLHDNNVRGYYSTVEALEAAQTNPYPGDLYGVPWTGEDGGYHYWIWDGVAEEWLDIGDIYQPCATAKRLDNGNISIAAGDPATTIDGLSSWQVIGVVMSTGGGTPDVYPTTCLVHDGAFRAIGGMTVNNYHRTCIGVGSISGDALTLTRCDRMSHKVGDAHYSSVTDATIIAVYGIIRKAGANE